MATKKTPTNNNPAPKKVSSDSERPKCGIIMPISAIDGLLPSHWEDVKGILREAIESAGFEAELVSETEESTIIHKTIIHNLYNNPIVVCDVSGKNPNVMFELGVRLTFDKPTVVVKDDKTDYSFDMSPIEHVGYPRDLRFHQIVQFKEKLAGKIKATHDLAASDHNYSTFLKHFGQFTVPKLEQTEVSPDRFIIERLDDLTRSVSRLERTTRGRTRAERDTLLDDIGFVFNFSAPDRESKERFKAYAKQNHARFPGVQWEVLQNRVVVGIPESIPKSELATLRHELMSAMKENETEHSQSEVEIVN
jgi:hypothetical protein